MFVINCYHIQKVKSDTSISLYGHRQIMKNGNQKWKSKIYKLGKVDDRIPVLQLPRSTSKKQIRLKNSRNISE